MNAKDLLAILEQFVAKNGGDTQITRIEWQRVTLGGTFEVRIETQEMVYPEPLEPEPTK